MPKPLEVLHAWINERADTQALSWWREKTDALREEFTERGFTIAFGMIPRKLGRGDLSLNTDELAVAHAARAGWDPSDWSIDQAARIALMLEFGGEGAGFHDRLVKMTGEAEVSEAVALYRGLALYPDPEGLIDIAGEGLRTNILSVFEAIAHRSPFPREMFDEHRWNHMVLKAVFIGSYLAPIQGLDERANDELAIILIDTARERRAASRDITFELWRCVGPFARQDMIGDIEHEFEHGGQNERCGAALALAAAPHGMGREKLQTAPELAEAIASGTLTWQTLSSQADRGLVQHFARPE